MPTPIGAAGVLLLTKDNTALFLKRGPTSDHPGEWCCPGGCMEDGESALDAALRETLEETGFDAVELAPALHARTVTGVAPPPDAVPAVVGEAALPAEPTTAPAPPVDFTTFLVKIKEPFTPQLCTEHTGYAWAPTDDPPQPIHPGVQIALDRLTMNELGVARAMAAGQLTSPQRYENVTLWAMRITAVGVAYRSSLDEFVWRDPDIYMNDEFLARCNGLPIIMEHPKRATLTSDEFTNRIIGTTFLPYLKPEAKEVWGIVKVYDDAANQMMRDGQLSTSPAVVFRDPKVNSKMELEDGSTLLIEGDPSLLDHLAVCEVGVWDKGGEPTGIETRADAEPARQRHQRPRLDATKLRRIDQGLRLLNVRLSNHAAARR